MNAEDTIQIETKGNPAPAPVCHDGVLAVCSLAGLGQAPLARPVAPEPRTAACFNELFTVN